MAELSLKKQLAMRKSALWTERSSWIARYQAVSQYLLPYSGRYVSTDRNRGDRSFNSIYDETATFALDTLTAGLMAGMSSPARPWFRLTIPDADLMESGPVRLWLAATSELMRAIFAKSNTYNSLHSMYEELGGFGTGAMIIEDDFDTIIHNTTFTAGEYAVATNDRGRVDTIAREFEMTTLNLITKFVKQADGSMDWSRTTPQVKNDWDLNRNLDKWRPVVHIIQPRTGRDIYKRDAKNMAFSSCYFEPGEDSLDTAMLSESGYKRFPCVVPRWHTRGGDIYGNAPSFRALGSIKQLQQEQLRKGQAIDYQTKPPLQVPSEMRNSLLSTLPGGISYVPMNAAGGGVRTAFEVRLDLNALLMDIQDVRGRINKAFYADLFLMMSNDTRSGVTATEVAERHEEKLLVLGPVLERLHNELLSPLIDLTFARMVETGVLPPAPPELEGMDLKVEFVSTLAQAQKMVGIGGLDGYLGRIAQVAAGSGDASVWDKVDKDQAADRYADMFGIDPSIVVTDDKVAGLREERQKAMEAQQKAAMVPAAASAAKDLAGADMSGDNALTSIMQQLQGYNANI